MHYEVELGSLICGVFDECCARYGDRELAAVAAEVALNDLLLRCDAQDCILNNEVPHYLELD